MLSSYSADVFIHYPMSWYEIILIFISLLQLNYIENRQSRAMAKFLVQIPRLRVIYGIYFNLKALNSPA